MAISKEIKKKILEDWLKAFPQLTIYANDKLYKIVGPLVIGIELTKLPRTEEYRPHFVIYPLWEKDIKTNLDTPIILKEYYNKKHFQYEISYEKHDLIFNDVLESILQQTPLPLNGDISLDKIISFLDLHSKAPPLSAAPNSYLQAALQEEKFKIALYINTDIAANILEQINDREWDINHFKACGIDKNGWLNGLHKALLNRDSFLNQISYNKQDKKIALLKKSELIF